MSSRKGISFKIDEIIINSNYIKNYNYYYDDPRELDSFKFIKELSDKDYFIMKAFMESDYWNDWNDFNNLIIDLNKCDNALLGLALEIEQKVDRFYEMNKEIRCLKRTLFSRLEKESK